MQARRSHRRARSAGALLLALGLALAVFGCASSGDTTSTDRPDVTVIGGDPSAAPDQVGGSGGRGETRGQQVGRGSTGELDGGAKDGNGSRNAADPAKGGDAGSDEKGQGKKKTESGDAGLEKVATKYCPKGIDLAQCKTLVKGSKQTEDTPSYEVTAPEDCLKAMSQSECEALYSAQKQAAESTGASVDVRACLENPTPKCEAIVRPIVEQQRAAEEASK